MAIQATHGPLQQSVPNDQMLDVFLCSLGHESVNANRWKRDKEYIYIYIYIVCVSLCVGSIIVVLRHNVFLHETNQH